jgi:hypothetical protein
MTPSQSEEEHQKADEDAEQALVAVHAVLNRLQGAESDLEKVLRLIERLIAISHGPRRVLSALLPVLHYQEYLQTHHWQKVRIRTMKHAGFRCMLCNAEGELHTHHRTYENIGREETTDTICLCSDCHATFHENHTADQQVTK